MRAQTGREALQAAVAVQQRAVAFAEARYRGLCWATHSAQPVLWFSRDPALQAAFRAGLEDGRALLANDNGGVAP